MYPSYSWERRYNVDGWTQNTPDYKKKNRSKSIFDQDDKCNGVSKFLETNNPFIHQADVNILLSRQSMINDKNDLARNYLKNALSHTVVSSEVRSQLRYYIKHANYKNV